MASRAARFGQLLRPRARRKTGLFFGQAAEFCGSFLSLPLVLGLPLTRKIPLQDFLFGR